MAKYECNNPDCDSFLDEVELPDECENPTCSVCEMQLDQVTDED